MEDGYLSRTLLVSESVSRSLGLLTLLKNLENPEILLNPKFSDIFRLFFDLVFPQKSMKPQSAGCARFAKNTLTYLAAIS